MARLPALSNLTVEERELLVSRRNECYEMYKRYVNNQPGSYLTGRLYGMYLTLAELLGEEIAYATMDNNGNNS